MFVTSAASHPRCTMPPRTTQGGEDRSTVSIKVQQLHANGCLDATSHRRYLVSLLYKDLGSNSLGYMQLNEYAIHNSKEF